MNAILPFAQTRDLCLLLLLVLTSFTTLAQTPTAAKTATTSVSGRLTDGETPIPGITVTDSDGRYRLTDLPAGRFKIVPHHALYVVKEWMPEFGEIGRAINLADGETVENVDFALGV